MMVLSLQLVETIAEFYSFYHILPFPVAYQWNKTITRNQIGTISFNQFSDVENKAWFLQVPENLEGPRILFWHFPRLESHGKRPLVLKSSGNLLNGRK